MRMLIAAAALIVAGGTSALAEEPACGQTKDAALVEARAVAQSVKGEVIEIADAALAQKAADQIFDALNKPHQPISAMIILKVPGGASLGPMASRSISSMIFGEGSRGDQRQHLMAKARIEFRRGVAILHSDGPWQELSEYEFLTLFAACCDVKKAFIMWQRYPPATDPPDKAFPDEEQPPDEPSSESFDPISF